MGFAPQSHRRLADSAFDKFRMTRKEELSDFRYTLSGNPNRFRSR